MTRFHACPGRCGKKIPPRHVACRACWWRLPIEIRKEITTNYRLNMIKHRAALQDAIAWYQANPLPAKETHHG